MSDSDDDLIAAEFALGTLDPAERAVAASRMATDVAFAARVSEWDRRLAPLVEGSPDIEAPPHLLAAILARLEVGRAPSPDAGLARTVVALNRSVVRWRRASVAISALAACLAVALAVDAFRGAAPSAPTLVAVLQRTDNPPAYLVRADLRDRSLSVQSLNANAPPGRAYELWLIDPQVGAPKSLGLLNGPVSTPALPAGLARDVLARATYAVTEEQAGGSPSGAPTGNPLFVGHLVAAAP